VLFFFRLFLFNRREERNINKYIKKQSLGQHCHHNKAVKILIVTVACAFLARQSYIYGLPVATFTFRLFKVAGPHISRGPGAGKLTQSDTTL